MSSKGIEMTRHRLLLLFFAYFLGSQLPANAFAQNQPAPADDRGLFNHYDIDNVKIETHDGLQLDARLYDPKVTDFSGKRPAVIFANSWTQSEYEYEIQARKFANRGYIVLAYATRGFGGSDGTVTVGGPNDIQDFTTVIDWLENNTRVDVKNIGMAGVSYGAGLSLLAAAFEPRIKTAVSLSGWGNLEDSLYRNQTIQKTWIDVLMDSGKLTGHLDPDVADQLEALKTRRDPAATTAWAAQRSPERYVDLINAKKAPIFLQNSYLDALFPPAQIRSFYERLEGPKRMITDPGIHASSAIPGLGGLPSPLWDEVGNWMDHWLMDPTVPVKTGITMKGDGDKIDLASFPALSSNRYALRASNASTKDGAGLTQIRITGNHDSGATTGVPFVGDILKGLVNVPVLKKITDIDTRYAAVLTTEPLISSIVVRGAPQLRFKVLAHNSPVTLVGYLYDVDKWGTGTLEAFSVMSLQDPSTDATDVAFNLNMTAFSVPKGHRLAVAIDTVDSLYTPATPNAYTVDLGIDLNQAIELPLVN